MFDLSWKVYMCYSNTQWKQQRGFSPLQFFFSQWHRNGRGFSPAHLLHLLFHVKVKWQYRTGVWEFSSSRGKSQPSILWNPFKHLFKFLIVYENRPGKGLKPTDSGNESKCKVSIVVHLDVGQLWVCSVLCSLIFYSLF